MKSRRSHKICFAPPREAWFWGVLILAVLGLTVYANAVFLPFVHDDLVFIRLNPDIARLDDWSGLFQPSAALTGDRSLINSYYRPFLEILYRLQYRLFGFEPAGYHLFNILLHTVNGILLFLLLGYALQRLSVDQPVVNIPALPVAWATAALFMVHPIQTEAVTCIAGVSNLVFTFFVFLSLFLYAGLRFKGARGGFLSGSLFCYLLALFFKEQAVFLPGLLIGFEFFLFRRIERLRTKNARRIFWRHIGFFLIMTLVYLLWRQRMTGTALTDIAVHRGELMLRLATIPRTLLMYLRLLVWPADLHYMRSLDILQQSGFSPFVFLALLTLVTILLSRLSRAVACTAAFGLVWFLVALLPVLNIIPLIHEYSWIAVFEHFLYFPAAGFFLFVVVIGQYVFARMLRGPIRSAGMMLIIALVLILGGVTIRQNRYWQSEIALFERAVAYEPGLGRLRLLLGKAYYFAGRNERSKQELKQALAIMQGYRQLSRDARARRLYEYFMREAYFVLAHIADRQEDFPQAAAYYQQALELSPHDSGLHKNIGLIFMRMNDCARAVGHFRQALALNPHDTGSMNNWAVCLMQTGQWTEAERLLQETLALDSRFRPAVQNLKRVRQLQTQKIRNH